jgi:hypothetical protein
MGLLRERKKLYTCISTIFSVCLYTRTIYISIYNLTSYRRDLASCKINAALQFVKSIVRAMLVTMLPKVMLASEISPRSNFSTP